MDDALFDRWTRGLADVVTRRGLGGLAVGALAAAGWAGGASTTATGVASARDLQRSRFQMCEGDRFLLFGE
jgi:hypothetical protein